MTVAAETRAAVRAHPFLHTALRTGIVNYTAAARFLDVGETEAVAAALRRYADELEEIDRSDRRVSVSMQSGIGKPDGGDGLLAVGKDSFAADGGRLTGIVATGDIGAADLETVLGRLRTADVDVVAAGGTDGHVSIVVDRWDGPDAVRTVEAALQATH